MTRLRVHIVTPTLSPGDAVAQDVLGMAAWCRERDCDAIIYAGFVHPLLRGSARHMSAYHAHLDSTDDLLIYHHSVGWPAGVALWKRSRNRRILRYHNITPGRFLQPYDPETADLCRRGVRETMQLARLEPELALAASDFSATELARRADRPYPIEVVPPLHALEKMDSVPFDETLAERLSTTTNLLFVGRVTPHKGHQRLFRVLARCRDLLGDDVRLHVVGGFDERLGSYYRILQRELTARGLQERALFPGKVNLSQLKTYYRHAAAFVCVSEHEGFCVPLVEAMRFGVPIVAYRGTAIGSTLGDDHPLLWDVPDPTLAAESIRMMVQDPRARSGVIAGQRERYQQRFTTKAIGRQLEAALFDYIESRPIGRELYHV